MVFPARRAAVLSVALAVLLPLAAIFAPAPARAQYARILVEKPNGDIVAVPGSATGALAVDATVNATATTVATATAAAGTCTEGQTDCPLSVDLNRNLRTLATSTSSATATAAAPSYSEGTANPLSQNLTGQLRILMPPLVAGTAQIGHVITDPTSVATIYGAAKGATTSSSATVTAAGADRNSLDVILRDSSGVEVTSFGATNASVSATGAAVPASGTYVGVLSGGNLVGMAQPVTDAQMRATAISTSDNHSTATTYLAVRLTDGTNFLAQDALGQTTMANSTSVAIASDQSAIPVVTSDALTAFTTATADGSTATTATEIIAASGSNRVLIKNWKGSGTMASTATANEHYQLIYGTGTNCGTGITVIDGCYSAANSGCNGMEIVIPASQAVCWRNAAAGAKTVTVTYRHAP